ncbi:hypothetical protein IX317_000644 [Fusobacterium sp. DD29]|uniref:phage tail tape measure protein n=1 Tax=unclassified Fusobacterium TaxID=2648384 RepID=UPI001B8A990A|nr:MULTISPECIES: phage tail tape measure protein [unclassified Fusobacterium]MBR8700234.1 hypothetical protein [Fusobacterium sp. DD45]MBR8710511.1 hypothetical protein [Fusobacterium sp. DD28]MBR8748983.1 hypothetical protein [Fusobacterium sp. DD29]MBR8751039.1 hypothetical protein [Fusobacterium sp. DD26]MBR8761289.1 hypothetical protein [Fusobacterium sp. DD25]
MAKQMDLQWIMGVAGVAEVVDSFKKVSSTTKDMAEQNKVLSKTQKKLENLDKVKKNYEGLNKEYLNACSNLKKLKTEYERTGGQNAQFAKHVKDAEKYVDRLNKQKERQRHVFEAARSALEKEGYTLENYKSKLADVNKQLAKQQEYEKTLTRIKKNNDLAKQFSDKGGKQIARGLKIGATLLIPVKLYADLEESQADLKKMIDFKDKAEEEAYFAQIRKLSENSPLKQTEVYEIAGAAAQSGVAKEDIVAFTERAMKLKVAFDMSTEAAGEFIAKSKNQLGLTQKQTFAFADVINYMADNTAAHADQLVEISNRVGGLARTQNVSKEANVAFGATLLSMGTSAEVASTGLKQLYLQLGKGADSQKKAIAFEYLGLNPDQVHKDMAKDAEGTIIRVLEKINQLKAEDKAAVINDIFGEQAINSVATLATNVDKVKENLKLAKSEMTEGSVDTEYANRMNTLTNTFKQAFNSISNILADMGKSLAPEIKESLKSFTVTLSKIANFVKENPKLTMGIMKAVGAFALFSITVGATNKMIGNVIPMFSWLNKGIAAFKLGGISNALRTMFPLLSKTFSFLFGGLMKFVKIIKIVGLALKAAFISNPVGLMKFVKIIKIVGLALKAAFISNPVGLIILAVVAAIAIFVVLYKKVDWFRAGVIRIFNGLKQYFTGIWKVIKGVFTLNFGLIKEGFGDMVDGYGDIFGGLFDIISNVWDRILGFLESMFPGITERIQSLLESIKKIFGGLFDYFRGFWEIVIGIFTGNFELVKKGFEDLIGGIKKMFDGLVDIVTGVWNKITGLFDDTDEKTEQLKNAAENVKTTVPAEEFKNLATSRSISIAGSNRNILPGPADTMKGTKLAVTAAKLNTQVASSPTNIVSKDNNQFTINITANGGDPNDIANAVKKAIAEMENKKKRTAII